MTAPQPSDAPVQPIVITPGAGRRIQIGPLAMVVIEDGRHTSGTHAVLECTLTGQFSPPPHIHRQHEEVLYVLDGEMAVPLGEQTVRLGPGAALGMPIGVPHTFRNGGTGTLRFLLTIAPASHVGYFEEQAAAVQAAGGVPDPQIMLPVMRRWGLEPLPPAS